MIQALPRLMTFQAFLDWKSEIARYELFDGVIVEMQPTGSHERVVGLLNRKLNALLEQGNLDYLIPNTAMIKSLGAETSYKPDLVLIKPSGLSQEPLWEQASVITLANSLKLVIEVVSTNWPDDYARKFEDFEVMGILEYWTVDFLGLVRRRYIGTPKQSTVTVCTWVDRVYETQLFRSGDAVISSGLLGLNLTVDQIIKVGK